MGPGMSFRHGPDETGIGLWKCLLIIFAEQNEPNFSAATFEAGLDVEAVGGLVQRGEEARARLT